ncbi:MAG: IS66 family transposase [Ruminococcus flavefaciens]|nr:IS66 family transposase [Ruminococcus flavefaciens]
MKKIQKAIPQSEERITISRSEYEAQKEYISKLEHEIEILTEAMLLARQKRFGVSSEHSTEDTAEQLSLLFNEAEVYRDNEAKEESGVSVTAYKRRKKQEYTLDNLPENIPVEVVEHCLPEEELACPECGAVMTEIGKEVRRRLEIIPAQVKVREDRYYTYACQTCSRENVQTPIVKAEKGPNFIPGSFATPEAAAYIMTQKFVMGSPLYRQEQELKRQGIPLSRQTMSNWLVWSAEHLLAPVYDRLHQELVGRDVLHADETTLQVLREPGKSAQSKSYIWLYRTGGDTDRPIVLYEYQPSREKCHPREFLAGFRGYLHTDGYGAYHGLPPEITVVGCWAHARRKFDEALKALPKGKTGGSSAAKGVAYCDRLFEIERRLAGLSPEKRYEQRLEQEKPVLDAMLAWTKTRAAAPKSALGKALTYLKEQWPYLCNYLEDGRLELSNNRAERSIKPFVIDRKNFLFANTPSGAKSSAVIFSLIETAKENGLDPYRYLTWVLQMAPGLIPVSTNETDSSWAAKLLPAHAPEECRIQRN